MPEILGIADHSKTIECNKCHYIIKYQPEEIKCFEEHVRFVKTGKRWIDCPKCKNEIVIEWW